jgi:opacity protein-like surface antigen
MVRAHLGITTLAAIASLAAGAARAADYSQPPPPPQQYIIQQPPAQDCCDGWYLRGFVGVGMNGSNTLDYLPNPLNAVNDFAFEQHSIADTFFIGGGVGYEWNNWLRFDVTGEYRAKTQVNAFGSYTSGGGTFGDAYQGYLKSWVFLTNAYVDLGTWNCFTPFVGVGIGAAYNTLADFTDIGIGTSGRGIGRNSSEWHLAWALHAGVAYEVSKNLKIDLAYRYLNYGSITDTIDCVGGCNADSYKFSNLYSHDIMLGLRWTCCELPPPPPAYTPPPPLRSRG